MFDNADFIITSFPENEGVHQISNYKVKEKRENQRQSSIKTWGQKEAEKLKGRKTFSRLIPQNFLTSDLWKVNILISSY